MKRIVWTVLFVMVATMAFIHCSVKHAWQGEYINVTYTKYPPMEDFKAAGYVVIAYDVRSIDKHSGVVYRFEMMLDGEKKGTLELCDRNVVRAFFEPDPKYEYYLLAGDSRLSGQSSSVFLTQDLRMWHKMYEDVPEYFLLKNDVIDVLSGE